MERAHLVPLNSHKPAEAQNLGSEKRHQSKPCMRVFKDFDEIKSAVGTEVGVSDWVIVTQARINRFAEATGDE